MFGFTSTSCSCPKAIRTVSCARQTPIYFCKKEIDLCLNIYIYSHRILTIFLKLCQCTRGILGLEKWKFRRLGVDTEHIQTQPHAHCLVWKLLFFIYWNTPESVKIRTDLPRVVWSVRSEKGACTSPTLDSVRRRVLYSVKKTLWRGVRKWYA